MIDRRHSIRNRKPSEEGFMLLIAVFFMALLVLSLSIAVPEIAKQIRRDREVETMHRGKQYLRAIQLYYRKFNAYPPNIGALVDTNNIRYLRRRYTDPLTGKDDWKPIVFGQNKATIAVGFFGMPLTGGGAGIGGIGPGGVGATGGIPGIGNTGGNGLGSSGFGSGSSGFGSSGFGSSGLGATGLAGANGTVPVAGQSNGNGAAAGAPGDAGGTNSNNGTSNGTSAGGSTSTGLSSLSGQTFGGGGIIGFAPARVGPSILIYKKMSQYNQWEFTYSPLMEIKQAGGGGAGFGGQPTGISQPGGGFGGTNNGGFGGTNTGGSGFGGGSTGFGGNNNGASSLSGTGLGGTNAGTGTPPGTPTGP